MGKKVNNFEHKIKLQHNHSSKIKTNSEIKKQTKLEHIDSQNAYSHDNANKKRQEKNIKKQQTQKINSDNQNVKKAKNIKKRARLIIRNLVFDINQKHIRKLISPFGQIKEINIPKHPDKNTSKGFAFVEMNNKGQCLKAISKLNGTQFKGRPIVLDIAVCKQNFMTQKLNQDKVKDEGQKQQKQEDLSQPQNQENKEEEDINENSQKNENQESQLNQKQQEQIQDQQQQDKAQKQKLDHEHQIFIRNLPISTTEDELYKHFIKLGKIAFVKVCKNKQTNVSKGTAFIKFKDSDLAKKLIEYSRSYQMFLLKKHNNFIPDPAIKLQIDGMTMKIFPVQTRNDIQSKLKQREGDNKKQVKKSKSLKRIKKLQDLVKIDLHDKRKLSLALLGRWKAHENMNKYDYQLLKNHQREKVERLKNPNSSISSTRIILKHLQKTITQDDLRTICHKFLDEHNHSSSILTYCKLMLEKDMKKSAGFAFVQFKKHEISKQFLQWMVKNSKNVQSKLFIVEFAIQDSRAMLKLSKKNNSSNPTNTVKSKDKKQVRGKKQQKNKSKKQRKPFKPRSFKKKFIKK